MTCPNDVNSDALSPRSKFGKSSSQSYRLDAVAAAMAVEPAKRAATYLKKDKQLVDTKIKAGGPPTKGVSTEENSVSVWREDHPCPIPNMVQIDLSDLKIKINLKDQQEANRVADGCRKRGMRRNS